MLIGTEQLSDLHMGGSVPTGSAFSAALPCCSANLQEYAKKAGPASQELVKLLLQHGAFPPSLITAIWSTRNLTPIHLLACWSPLHEQRQASEGTAATGSSSRSKQGSGKSQDELLQEEQEHCNALTCFLTLPLHDIPTDMWEVARAELVNVVTAVNGETPLLFAACTGAYAVAKLLIKAGADVNKPRAKDAVRPLDLAVEYANSNVAILLLEEGAEVSVGTVC
jgi:hypothetical protein